ncbi:hypothetical protein QBC35DRAFT_47565 [Podospora australis]|uniref:Uncharacterized protein n=1 Tax=Podospora australis TaxID=1536484 RepID=A0AAN6WQM9_9PEZI|nr:hypothetical protein QBC35DRAFT_47565 [Podospora australis]
MKLSCTLISTFLALSVTALPAPAPNAATTAVATGDRASASSTTSAAAVATTTAAAGAGEGEGEGEENEVELEGQFGQRINLGGGNVKTDVLFPASLGSFEVEFQNQQGRVLTVTENKTPAPPPTGFTALEPVSYVVQVRGGGTRGLTLQKIDYILSANNTLDISAGQIGRFCREANGFVIGAGVGELEFEVEENELTLTVDSLVGEWGIFVPTAAAGAGAGAGAEAEAGAGAGAAAGACGAGTACRALLDAILRLGGGAAARK